MVEHQPWRLQRRTHSKMFPGDTKTWHHYLGMMGGTLRIRSKPEHVEKKTGEHAAVKTRNPKTENEPPTYGWGGTWVKNQRDTNQNTTGVNTGRTKILRSI